MKELWIALAMAWGIMALVGCSAPSKHAKTWQGSQSHDTYMQTSPGFVRDLGTGEVLYRRGPAWVEDTHGRMHYTYGGIIEDAPRGSTSSSGARSR